MSASQVRTIRHLRELIAALDWRLPQVARVGETRIASEAAALRADALTRIAEIEREMALETGALAPIPAEALGRGTASDESEISDSKTMA
jgi:hypothetical protein